MKIKVNWYKPSGKWYAQNTLELPDDFKWSWDLDVLKAYIEYEQKILVGSWVSGDWFMSITTVEQANEDQRFAEYLFKYGDV